MNARHILALRIGLGHHRNDLVEMHRRRVHHQRPAGADATISAGTSDPA